MHREEEFDLGPPIRNDTRWKFEKQTFRFIYLPEPPEVTTERSTRRSAPARELARDSEVEHLTFNDLYSFEEELIKSTFWKQTDSNGCQTVKHNIEYFCISIDAT
jgi:hypothetical protein